MCCSLYVSLTADQRHIFHVSAITACVLRWSFRYCGEVVRFRVNAFAVCDFKSSFQCTVVCNVAHYPSVQCAVVCMCRPLPISTYLPMLSMLSLCARCKHSRDKALFLLLVRGYQNTSRNSARLRRLMLGASSPEQFLHDIYSGLPVEA